MDNSRHRAESAHLLEDLESIRELLGDDAVHAELATGQANGEPQIPLLFDVVGERRVPHLEHDDPQDIQEQDIPTLLPEPPSSSSLTFIAAEPTEPVELHQAPAEAQADLEGELRDAASSIMQAVIAEFSPHIEAEIRRRLDARLESLLLERTRKL